MSSECLFRIDQQKVCNSKLHSRMDLRSTARLPRHARPFCFAPSAPALSPLHVAQAQSCTADYTQSLLYWERLRVAAALVANGAASPALHPIALAEQQSGRAEAATVVATPQPATKQAPATAGLIRSRVVKSRRGYWRIRHYQPTDLLEVAELQAAAFHESLPVGALDKLAYTLFKAEVLDALKKKVAVLCDDSFAMLVVESCQLDLQDTFAVDTINSDSDMSSSSDAEASGDWDAEETAVWYGDQQAAALPSRPSSVHHAGQQHLWDPAAASDPSPNPAGLTPDHSGRIMGVVEVGVHDERDVLQHLSNHQGSYAYISSMAVSPQIRRSGIGRALLQAAEQQALNWKQQLVALHVYTTNTPAIKLYERHGMKCEAQDPAWRGLLGAKVRQLLVKDLSARNLV